MSATAAPAASPRRRRPGRPAPRLPPGASAPAAASGSISPGVTVGILPAGTPEPGAAVGLVTGMGGRSPTAVVAAGFFLFRSCAGRCEPCSADAGDYETGRSPADQSPRWRARPPAARQGRRQNPHHRIAGSTHPEPGTRRGAPGSLRRFLSGSKSTISAAVNGYPAATLAPAGMTPPGRSPGKWPRGSPGGSPGK